MNRRKMKRHAAAPFMRLRIWQAGETRAAAWYTVKNFRGFPPRAGAGGTER